jgi:hypothetical protein
MGLFKSKRTRAKELVESGSKGVGTVLRVQSTDAGSRREVQVTLTFRVEPLDGGPTFDLTKSGSVSRVEIPRQGDRYPVWYDPQNLDEFVFVTVTDDKERALLRERFGDAAETFVGMDVPEAPKAKLPG